jgi:hypothetical protein
MQNRHLAMIKSRLLPGLILSLYGALVLGHPVGPQPTWAQGADVPRRVNVPYFSDGVSSDQGAIFWFGYVTETSNYADVRVGYDDDELHLTLHVIDRRLWYDASPTLADLADWDAVTLYLHLDGNTGNVPTSNSYRFVTQVNWWEARTDYQAVYRGNGSGWVATSIPFTTTSGWRGNAFNDDQDDKGWLVEVQIPFASLGLPGPPAPGRSWGLAVALHDRDDPAGTAIPDQVWPEVMEAQRPATWGQLVFGMPGYAVPPAVPGQLVTVRQGLNGASVVDAHVGGHTTCGSGLDHWNEWGAANYAGYAQINIQNQWDISDYPCFSKYYVTFPLNGLPSGKAVISATLTMHLFGNAGYVPGDAQPSLIQALSVKEDWDESTLSWNNAPLAQENVAATWVDPVDFYAEWPGVPYTWDVSRAVAEAYAAGEPLRLALYSADGEMHSGKYFYSSDADEAGRPALQVLLGDPGFTLSVTPATQMIRAGQAADYNIQVQHHAGFSQTVTLEVGESPSPDLTVDLASPSSFDPPGGQTILTLADTHDPNFSARLWYTIPITATGGGVAEVTTVTLLLSGEQVYLPLIAVN